MAMTMAETAIATCKANGYNVSANVLGRNGEVIVAMRGDNTGPHTLENSMKKAYTAQGAAPVVRRFRRFASRTTSRPARSTSPTSCRRSGALPIKVGEDTIGAIGVSGAPGGEKDEACAKAGIDKVSDRAEVSATAAGGAARLRRLFQLTDRSSAAVTPPCGA